jgi:signal transduction histidine kinase
MSCIMESIRILRTAAMACLFAILIPMDGSAQTTLSSSKTYFEAAEFLLSDEERPPADSAAWRPVRLPDEWRHTVPSYTGRGWYRVVFELAQQPTGIHAIFLPHRRSHRIDYFVNGNFVGGSSDVPANNTAGTLMGSTVFITVPPFLLRIGKNVIHLRMDATASDAAIQGLGRVYFGAAREVRKDYIRRIEQEAEALRSFYAVAFSAGLIALCLWFARHGDRVMLLLAIAYLSWAFVTAWQRPLRWVELSPVMRSMLQIHLSYGLPPLAFMLCLRTAGLVRPRLETAAWIYLCVVVTFPVWRTGDGEEWRLVLDAINIALLLAAAVTVVRHAGRSLRWPIMLQTVTLLLMAALIASEFLRYFGWIPADAPVIRHFHALAMFVGIGTAIFADHVLSLWRARSMSAELERRVAEKKAEIQANRARMEQAKREQALVRERQRIVGDMHDGLGASLVSLLRYAQTQRGDSQIEQRVKEALQELRIAIDALEPSRGDLGAVLGNLRYRLAPLLESTAIQLDWDVAELPPIGGLEPSAVFALQRIVLEAVANALKHSRAGRITLSARESDAGSVEIRVEDDGVGFYVEHPGGGSGILNLHARAARIGARVEISSRPNAGTRVLLSIPAVIPASPDDPASEILEPFIIQDPLPAPPHA